MRLNFSVFHSRTSVQRSRLVNCQKCIGWNNAGGVSGIGVWEAGGDDCENGGRGSGEVDGASSRAIYKKKYKFVHARVAIAMNGIHGIQIGEYHSHDVLLSQSLDLFSIWAVSTTRNVLV